MNSNKFRLSTILLSLALIAVSFFFSACNSELESEQTDGDTELEFSSEADDETDTPLDGDEDFYENENEQTDFDEEAIESSDGDEEYDNEEQSEVEDDTDYFEENHTPAAGEIVFSEIMYDTTQPEQWAELLNISDRYLNLSGCHFNSSLHSSTIDADIAIAPGARIILAAQVTENLPSEIPVAWRWPENIIKIGRAHV